MQLANVQIPSGCTHWVKIPAMNSCTDTKYRFYKVAGPENEVVYIHWGGKWMKFEEYQQWIIDNTPFKHKVPVPNFNSKWMNRFEETANDKVQRIAEGLK